MGISLFSIAEINVGTSIEWLCANSDLVPKGKIVSTASSKKGETFAGFTSQIAEF